uniref:Uncharacterized protein n=1 Tax=Bos mutus grunniens TaxID=30521 RepID=A0A8B9WW16_BOSMU
TGIQGKCGGLGEVLLTTVFLPYFSIFPASLFDFSCSQTEPTEAYKTGYRDSKNSEKSALLLST